MLAIFIIILILSLYACEPGYIDSRQMHGIVKNVNFSKIDVNGEIYWYDASLINIVPGDTIQYVIRNYRNTSDDFDKLLIVKSVNGSIIK